MPLNRASILALAALLAFTVSASGETYYVATNGSDKQAGLSGGEAFRTIQRGVNALKPGDTLIIGPGVYHEEVRIEKSGSPERPITIRSQYPRRAHLVGSVRLSRWSRVPDTKHAWRAPLARVAYLVCETDTDTEYLEVANLRDLDRTPGSHIYDEKEKALYVHPTDSEAMGHHVVDACVLDYGFVSQTATPYWNHRMRRVGVRINGFVVSGYSHGGIMARNADYCEVKDCVVYHTRRGIFFHGAFRSRIAGCEAFSNQDRFMQEMGDIGIMSYSSECVIENNVAYNTPQYGIRYYGAFNGNVMRGNLAYGCQIGIHVKGSFFNAKSARRYLRYATGKPEYNPNVRMMFERNVAHNCISWGLIPKACVFRNNTGVLFLRSSGLNQANLLLQENEVAAARFVDPAYHDLRLQSDTPHRIAGPNGGTLGAFPYRGDVFFVKSDGDDAKAGTSVASAWKTLAHACRKLRTGHTLYALPGVYKEGLSLKGLKSAKRTILRAHGRGTVVLDVAAAKRRFGVSVENCQNALIQGFRIRGAAVAGIRIADSQAIEVTQNEICRNRGAGILSLNSEGVKVTRNVVCFNSGKGVSFTGGARRAWVVGNIIRENGAGDQLTFTPQPGEDTFCDYNNITGKGLRSPGLDAHSIDEDPGFASASRDDFRLRPDSLCRGRGFLGKAIGTGRIVRAGGGGPSFDNVRVDAVSPFSADISWTSRGRPTTVAIRYGVDPARLDKLIVRDTGHFYRTHHVYTLTDLRPGVRYFFRVGDRTLLEGGRPYHGFNYSWPALTPAGEAKRYRTLKKKDTFDSRVRDFVTPTALATAERVFYVSPDGDDSACGSRKRPWRSIARACEAARAGDRVVVRAGTYCESIEPRRSGVPGRPITFEAAKGERVVISGKRLLIPTGADLTSRRHIVIRGFFFEQQAQKLTEGSGGAQVFIVDAADILVERCVFDGRMNYLFAAYVYRSRDVSFRNNIVLNHWSGMIVTDNSGLIELRRNTFLGPTIHKLYAVRNDRVVVRSNLLGENLYPKKRLQYKVVVIANKSLDMDRNCYYFDKGNREQRMVDLGLPKIDMAKVGPLPEGGQKTRFAMKGESGLKLLRGKFGMGRNSFLADPGWVNPQLIKRLRTRGRGWPDRFRNYPAFTRGDLKLRDDSPCLGKGDKGENAGADYSW